MSAAFSMFFDAIISGFAWFTQVFTAAGLLDLFTGIMIITIVFNRIIAPMLRGRGSDRADRRRNKKGEG